MRENLVKMRLKHTLSCGYVHLWLLAYLLPPFFFSLLPCLLHFLSPFPSFFPPSLPSEVSTKQYFEINLWAICQRYHMLIDVLKAAWLGKAYYLGTHSFKCLLTLFYISEAHTKRQTLILSQKLAQHCGFISNICFRTSNCTEKDL